LTLVRGPEFREVFTDNLLVVGDLPVLYTHLTRIHNVRQFIPRKSGV
jgi:hypothetical protein